MSEINCPSCGSRLGPNDRFCTGCGAAVAGAAMVWEVELSLLGDPYMRGNIIKGCLATTVVMALILVPAFGYASGWDGVRQALLGVAAAGVGIALLSLFSVGVVLGNSLRVRFRVDEDGVSMSNVSSRARAIHRFSWILAIAMGRPDMAGPGLLARATETHSLAWDEIKTVTVDQPRRVAIVKGAAPWDTVLLYGTEGNFPRLLERLGARKGA